MHNSRSPTSGSPSKDTQYGDRYMPQIDRSPGQTKGALKYQVKIVRKICVLVGENA